VLKIELLKVCCMATPEGCLCCLQSLRLWIEPTTFTPQTSLSFLSVVNSTS